MKPRTTKVFLVDDHPIVRLGLATLIAQERDFTVCGEAASAEEALPAILDKQPDIAIIDIMMGKTDGLELTRTLTRRAPSVKVLVLSVHSEDMYTEPALRAGARGFLTKQEAPGKVVQAMREIMAGDIYVSNSMKNRLLLKGAQAESSPKVARVGYLSRRELEVFRLIGQGAKTGAIAERLQLSAKTVNAHREHIKRKLGVTSAPELVKQAIEYVAENP